jgi:type I restriction enzyme S subunit
MNNNFKQTDIGLIPEDWELYELSKIAKITSGGTPSRKISKYYSGNYLWVKSGELEDNYISDTEEKITEEAIENSSAKIFPVNTILIALYGATVGKTAILLEKATTNQAVCAILPNQEKFNSEYVRFYLITIRDKLLSQRYGGAQPNISQTIIKNTIVPLPILLEQKKIVYVLSKIQQAIETQEQIIKKTQELKKALMQKLFAEGLKGEPQKQTEIGPIPESWEVKKIEEVYIFTRKPRNRNITANTMIPFIPMECISDSEIDANVFISKKYSEIPSGTYFENGDLLLAKITPSFENGKQGIADINFIFGYATTEVIPIKAITNKSDIRYLHHYLKKEDVRKILAGKMEGSTGRQRLPKSIVQATLIPFPELSTQKKIISIFSNLDYKIHVTQQRTKYLKELFNNVLNILMTGQIRVKDIEFEKVENLTKNQPLAAHK